MKNQTKFYILSFVTLIAVIGMAQHYKTQTVNTNACLNYEVQEVKDTCEVWEDGSCQVWKYTDNKVCTEWVGDNYDRDDVKKAQSVSLPEDDMSLYSPVQKDQEEESEGQVLGFFDGILDPIFGGGDDDSGSDDDGGDSGDSGGDSDDSTDSGGSGSDDSTDSGDDGGDTGGDSDTDSGDSTDDTTDDGDDSDFSGGGSDDDDEEENDCAWWDVFCDGNEVENTEKVCSGDKYSNGNMVGYEKVVEKTTWEDGSTETEVKTNCIQQNSYEAGEPVEVCRVKSGTAGCYQYEHEIEAVGFLGNIGLLN